MKNFMRRKRKLHKNVSNNSKMSRARKRKKIRVKRRFYIIIITISIVIILLWNNSANKKKNENTNDYVADFPSESENKTEPTKDEVKNIQVANIDFDYMQGDKMQTVISLTIINKNDVNIENKTYTAIVKDIYDKEIDKIEITIGFLGAGDKSVINFLSDKYLITIAKVELIDNI